jgi:hypothetical protein
LLEECGLRGSDTGDLSYKSLLKGDIMAGRAMGLLLRDTMKGRGSVTDLKCISNAIVMYHKVNTIYACGPRIMSFIRLRLISLSPLSTYILYLLFDNSLVSLISSHFHYYSLVYNPSYSYRQTG